MAVSYDCVRSRTPADEDDFSALGVGYGITDVVSRRFLDLRVAGGIVFCVMYCVGANGANCAGATDWKWPLFCASSGEL